MSARDLAPLSSLRDLAVDLAEGATTPAALLAQTQERLDACAGLNALITRVPEPKLPASPTGHPLWGVPYAHKDLYCTAGVRTTAGSKMLENFVPPYSAHIHERLAAAGAVLIGKANMDEFAMGSSNEHSAYGPVANPHDPRHVAGGSSGGSAALVAARAVRFATASDTGGSIRQPAAFCGVTGIKPTWGRVSRHGMIAYASSLDQAGVIATSAVDCAMVLGCIAGHDPRDSTSKALPVPDWLDQLDRFDPQGLRIGLPTPMYGEGIDVEVLEAVAEARRVLEQAGATVVDVELPHAGWAIAAYYVIAPCEASSNLARYDGVRYGHRAEGARNLEELYTRSRSEALGAEVQRRILIGSFALSAGYYDAYYLKAQRVRRLIAEDFARAFEHCDLLLSPTTPTPAFKIGEKLSDPLAMYAADVNTVAVNLAGLPAMSLPCGYVGRLPVGLQLIGKPWDEGLLLAAAHAYQRRTAWHRVLPESLR
jgi:aspartyl-tRNA(Asn)/glutamyl-tRNA(Gln) amidotransferase subunit A